MRISPSISTATPITSSPSSICRTSLGRRSCQSEETLFATCNVAGVRVFDIRDQFAPKEIASWVPPTPKKLVDPRPNVSLAAKSADIFVRKDGMMFVSDWNAGLNILQFEG